MRGQSAVRLDSEVTRVRAPRVCPYRERLTTRGIGPNALAWGMSNEETAARSDRGVPTVSASLSDGSLVELVCDSTASTTHLAHATLDRVSIADAIETADGRRLIPVPAKNNLIRHGVLLLPEGPVPFGALHALMTDIEAYISRYVDLTPEFLRIASAYVVLTWLYDAFNELPYLRFRGDYGSGKTRALLVIGGITYKPFFASGASTISPIFHALDTFRSTLIVDESDFRMSDEKAELVKVFNNGNVRGFPVLRSQATQQHTFDPRAFHVFGPKIVAMRRSFDDPALESRFITEDMGRQTLRPGIPINLPNVQRDEARELRNKLLAYRFKVLKTTKIDPTAYDERLSPRTNQILAPLLSVIDDASVRQSIRKRMASVERSAKIERSGSPEGQVLEVVLSLIGSDTRPYVPIGEITTAFVKRYGREYERVITPRYVGHLLRNRLRLQTYKRHGNFVLPTAKMEHLNVLAERYGVRHPAQNSALQ